VAKVWREPDEGIWEVRGPRRHFTHSKIMAWVAVDRALRGAKWSHLPAPVDDLRVLAAEIKADIWANGYDPKRNTFTRAYDDSATHNTSVCGEVAHTEVTFSVLQLPWVSVRLMAQRLFPAAILTQGLRHATGSAAPSLRAMIGLG